MILSTNKREASTFHDQWEFESWLPVCWVQFGSPREAHPSSHHSGSAAELGLAEWNIFSNISWNIFTAHLGEPKSGHPEGGFGQVGLAAGGHHAGRLSDLCFLQSYETLNCRQWSRLQLTVSVKFDCVAAPHKLETVDLYSTVSSPYYSPLTE